MAAWSGVAVADGLWSTPARRDGGRSLWELPKAPMRVVRPFIVDATTGERAWKRERVSAPPCMWDLGRFEARLLGTSCLTPSNELPDWGVLLQVQIPIL